MWHVVGCITGEHDLRLVGLAAAMGLFACVTAMSMLARAKASSGRVRVVWLSGAGLAGGSGIWATHFVAMLAYRESFPVAYDIGLTVLSIVIAMVLCAVGFGVALRRPLLGGAVAGIAISAMHYVGMQAMQAPAIAIWDLRYVVASVVVGVVPMALVMPMVIRRESFRGYAVGAVVFALAICAMHFTGMSALTLQLDSSIPVPHAVMDPTTLAIAVAAIGILIVALGLIVALVDYHLAKRASAEAVTLRAHIVELEATKSALEATSGSLREALTDAAAANKAKSQFLASMSHELRTPLNAVIGFSEVLERELFGPLGNEHYKAYAHDIRSSGQHLLALISDILDLSRIDAGRGELVEEIFAFHGIVHEAVTMVAHQAEDGRIQLFDEVRNDLPLVLADRRRIKQVLINLLSNAVKFTPEGGRVRITARRSEAGIAVAIGDTGIGIAATDIAKVFEPFSQIDSTLARKYEGTGLGLPLSRKLMELHDGTLTLESAVDIGTTVTILLPASRIVVNKIAATG